MLFSKTGCKITYFFHIPLHARKKSCIGQGKKPPCRFPCRFPHTYARSGGNQQEHTAHVQGHSQQRPRQTGLRERFLAISFARMDKKT